jgi:hypothetical protein
MPAYFAGGPCFCHQPPAFSSMNNGEDNGFDAAVSMRRLERNQAMATDLNTAGSHELVAANCAGGGVARQFRVQFHPSPAAPWRMYASFRSQEPAEACVDRLHEQGYEARLVKYVNCPTAA